MPLVTFKDICIDANDVSALQGFWSHALGLTVETFDDGGSVLRGAVPAQTVWVNLVPEAKGVKNRVHLDLAATSLELFAGLEQLSAEGEFPWTVFADPEGNELCVFVYDDRAPGLKDVVVDATDHVMISAWWADVWGGDVRHVPAGDGGPYSHVDDIPNAPVESFDFVPVPEPKTVKNRLHWDVTLTGGATISDLEAKGATVLVLPTVDDRWTVMADPEGNEFCVFDAR
ncbi:MAG: hypothetical protein JWP31_1046 [Aeromicrobium sp.]|nr:hypothetical protein [Aeromicrobium sp.]